MYSVINPVDMRTIRSMAEKYGMTVADFGRFITRQSVNRTNRQVRVTPTEYEIIRSNAKRLDLNVSRYCELCCKQFLENVEEKGISPEIFRENQKRKEKRTRLFTIMILNGDRERKLAEVAATYSIKISSLIRYCALNMDIVPKGDGECEGEETY